MVKLDADALSQLYVVEGPHLLAFAMRRTFDADAALDIVGETFALAFERRKRFRGETREEAVAWLYSICRSTISHRFRRQGAERRALRRLGVEPPAMEDAERQHLEDLAGLGSLRAAVRAEMNRLPIEQQAALQLRVVDELAYDDVAQQLGITQQTARARVSRGLRALTRNVTAPEELHDV